MKVLIPAIFFSLFITISGISQSCLPNGILFSRQSQIDSFPLSYPGCINIEGDVQIEGHDILALDSLYHLEVIGGILRIAQNSNLSTLVGLHSLSSIGQSFSIIGNPYLGSLEGLDVLVDIRGDFLIHDNDGMTNLSGANKFHIALGDLLISQNDNLAHPAGLSVDSILGTLFLEENQMMEDLNGLDSLIYIGGDLLIQNNASLTTLSGIDSLQYVGDHLEIVDNASLNIINALAQLKNSPWELLKIENCPQLSDCAIRSICNHLAADGNSIIANNASGCNSVDEVEAECTVDVENPNDAANIFIYPNPTSGSIHIMGIISNYTCTLYNIHGQLIQQWNADESQTNLENISAGIYILTIEWKDHVVNKQVHKY